MGAESINCYVKKLARSESLSDQLQYINIQPKKWISARDSGE